MMSQNALASASSSLTYSVGFRTDVGRQRSLNEDAVAAFDLPGTTAAFVVCDGMGGLSAGDVASNTALNVVRTVLIEKFAGGVPADPEAVLREAFTRANDAVNALHSGAPTGESGEDAPTVRRDAGMTAALTGTTCVAGFVLNDALYVAHAGDSRAYLWRAGRLTRLTEDHSYVAERVKAGDITEAEARVSKFRNMITRAIGIDPVVNPDVRREPLAPGDTVLVCSDGLTTMLEDPEIAPLLRAQERADAERAASALVDAANKKGGHDNVTILLLRVGGEGRPGAQVESVVPGDVVDLDAPRRRGRGGANATVIVILAALVVMASLAAGVLFMRLRQEQAKKIPTEAFTPSGVASSPLTIDYARLQYEAPKPFAGYLARGDILAYSREGGLFIVGGGTGALVALDKMGKPGRALTNLETVASTADIPPAHVFVAADPQGNVYVSYTKSRAIVKRSREGQVLKTLRGFERPEALAVDDDGNLYVIDAGIVKVLKAYAPNAIPQTRASAAAPAPLKSGKK